MYKKLFNHFFNQKFFSFFFISLYFLLFLTGCKNFLNGEDFILGLENSIDYKNRPYAYVTISSSSDYTKQIIPAAQLYDNKYKLSDIINLSFSVKENYQFLYWKAEPASAISFEDIYSLETTATVLSAETPITISPVCLIRPTVSFEPENRSDGVPKNTSIVINFSHQMKLTEDDLNKIKIYSGLEDISVNFQYPPIVNEEKTKITFVADRENLINVTSGTKVVNVTVPKDFYYLYGEEKITLQDDYSYSYRVNSTTVDKATINVTTISGGEINYVGKETYSLDDELTLSFTPASTYDFAGWMITDAAGKEIEDIDCILHIEPSLDKTAITVKVLTGYDKSEIQIFPVCNVKGQLTINFTTDTGSIKPSDRKECYKDDEFELSYTEENSGYAFSKWIVYDSITKQPVTDAVEIKKEDSPTTTVKVLKDSGNITIKPECIQRPEIKFFIPADGKEGLVRNTSIRILFTQPMDETTLKDRNLIRVTQGVLRTTSEQIAIDETDVRDILDYTTNSDNSLLSINLQDGKLFQTNAYVYVYISKNVKNSDGVSINQDLQYQFQVSETIDGLAPIINEIYVGIGDVTEEDSGEKLKSKYDYFDVINYKTADQSYDRYIQNNLTIIDAAYVKYKPTNAPDKKIDVLYYPISTQKLNFYIQADDLIGYGESKSGNVFETDVATIGYRITQVLEINENGSHIGPVNNPFTYENTFSYSGDGGQLNGKSNVFSTEEITNGTTFTLDLDDLGGSGIKAPDGILRIDIWANDKNGNNGLDEKYWYKHGNGYRTVFIARETVAPKITNPVWHKKFYDSKIEAGIKNGVQNDSYIKMNLTELLSGISTIDIELKDSNEQIIARAKDENVKLYASSNFTTENIYPIDRITDSSIEFVNKRGVGILRTPIDEKDLYITGLIDNEIDEGEYSLKITIKDAAGNASVIDSPIFVDRVAPELTDNVCNPKVAAYTFTDGNNSENIYPRVDQQGITSASFWDTTSIPNGDGIETRWFYTNAWNSKNIWGLNLKQEFTKSNISQTAPAYILHQKNSNTTLSDQEIQKITRDSIIANPTEKIEIISGNTFEKYFDIGTHSIVLMNDSGDVSKACTFVVVKDDKGPEMVTSDNRSLKYLITLDCPNLNTIKNSHHEYWYRHTSPTETEPYMDWYPYDDCYYVDNTKITNMYARNIWIVCKESEINNNNIIVRLSGSGLNAEPEHRTIYPYTQLKPELHPNDREYWKDSKPSRTSSGIAQYYICRVFYTWRNEKNDNAYFLSVFPPETNVKDRFMKDIYHLGANSMFYYISSEGVPENKRVYDENYTDNPQYFDKWQEYIPGSDITIPIFKDYGFEPVKISKNENETTYKYWMPPINLCFKDNCGNIDYTLCTHPTWEDYSSFAFRIDVTDYVPNN